MEPGLGELGIALLKLALFGLSVGLALTVTVGLIAKGPVRWVKILSVLLVVTAIASSGALFGMRQALGLAAVMGAVTVLSMTVGMVAWSQPRRKSFEPVAPQLCPPHARVRVDGWSSELHSMGFLFHSDQIWRWRFAGAPRQVFVRFFTHASEPIRAELHALDKPKMAARSFTSLGADGRSLTTCDQQADAEHFPSEMVNTRRVASASSCESMVEAHRAAILGLGQSVPTEDPVAAHLDSYHRWVDELVEAGILKVRADNVRIRLGSLPRVTLSVLSAWFH